MFNSSMIFPMQNDGRHPDHDHTADVERLRSQADSLLELDLKVLGKVVTMLPVREQYAFLDVGCAHGYIAHTRFPRLGVPFHCLGIDHCASAVAQARAENNDDDRFLFTCAGIEDIEPEDYGRFDIILAGYVMQHVTNPEQTIQQLWNLLAPGGALIIRSTHDGMQNILPSNSDLECLLNTTVKLTRGTDHHFTRKLHTRLLRLSPAPSDMFIDFKVDNSTGLDVVKRNKLIESAFSFREGYAYRLLKRSDATSEERTLAQESLEDAQRQRTRFTEDSSLFFAITHGVAVAIK